MTTNNEEYRVIEDISEEHKEGLKIVEEDEFESKTEIELDKLYENNKDAIDLIGGLNMFEALLEINDEDFETLRPQMIALFIAALDEPETKQELQLLALTQNYTAETAKKDFDTAAEAINEVDFLSNPKKDFLKELYSIVCNKLQEVINSINKIIHIPCQLEEGVQLPIYAHKTDAGLDIYAREEITINPGETKIIGTGIKTAIPEGYAILIQPRSGQSVKTKLRIANTPGLIDSGYRDEIGVIIENIEPPFKDIDYEFDDNGEIHIKSILHGEAYTIAEGQRFAQMRLVQVPKAEFVQVESVGEIGEDRGGGFGSTGIG
jgi:dUTP pyrophosphatase